MKRLDVKKLAAIGAGAALIGLALAPMAAAALTKDQVLKGDKTPFDVVVGKNAATSDYLWAGNIAAKLAQLATDDTEVSCKVAGWQEGKGPTGEGTSKACTGLNVDLTIGGTQTYSSESSKTYNTTNLDSAAGQAEFLAEISQSQLGTLYKDTKSWRYKGTSYNQTITEYIGIQADAKMDYTHAKVDDLVLLMDSVGDFNYRVNYSKGLPVDNDTTDNSDFVAADTDNVIAVLFGNEYKLYDVDTTRSGGALASADKIKLVKASGEKTYNVSETIEGLAGAGEFAGKTMSMRVDNVWSTTEAEFTLLDEEGNEVDNITTSTEGIYLEQSFADSQGDYALDTSLYLKAVNFNAATGSGNIVIAKGSDLITIQNSSQYPYSATDTDTTNDRWIASFTTGTSSSPDANVITDITIYNSVKLWKYASDTAPLYSGKTWALTDAGKTAANKAVFLEGEATTTPGYGYAEVIFNGWKGDEDRTAVKIGNGAYVEYTDSDNTDHKVPFYFQLSNNSTQGTFVIDTQTFYYKTAETDANFQIDATTDLLNGIAVMGVDGNLITDQGKWTPIATLETKNIDMNGVNYTCTTYNAGPAWDFNCMADGYFQVATEQLTSSIADSAYIGYSAADTTNSKYWYYDDANNKRTVAGRATIPLTGSSTNNKVYKYAFMDSETTYGDLWLLLDATTNFDLQYSKDIQLYGTDTGEDGVVDATYYLPNELDLGGGVVNSYYIATFGLVDNSTTGTWDTRIYIDTAEDTFPTYQNSNLSWYGNDVNYNDTAESWALHPDSPDSYTAAAYTDFGSKFSTTAGYFEASMPQNQEKLWAVVTGIGTTTTTTGGTSFCADGCDYPALESGVEQLVDTTSYIIENIACESCTCAAGGNVEATDVEVSPNVKTVKDLKNIGLQIVYTDDAAPNFGVVIVGGHLANTLAANATFAGGLTLADKLTAAGDNVVEATEDGDWVVAGFMATDTVTAAKEFIDQLDAVFG
ncbi:MAG: hypothetical protein V1493_01055 [Candidatus Diapherotrites archaeon]